MANTQETILVVDDKTDIVETVSFCFTQEGFKVLTTFDGEQALAVARQEKRGSHHPGRHASERERLPSSQISTRGLERRKTRKTAQDPLVDGAHRFRSAARGLPPDMERRPGVHVQALRSRRAGGPRQRNAERKLTPSLTASQLRREKNYKLRQLVPANAARPECGARIPADEYTRRAGGVRCRERLGGVLKYYYRDAA